MNRLADTIGILQEHFEELRKVRLEYNPEFPVFALEHPLDQADVHALAKDLREALRRERQVVPEHALAWVVIASETGYGFGGCEFWRSFDERIPDWAELGDRDALRRAFMQFSCLYHGVQPTGKWAARYTLICWPITHAILPRDLQLHLCEAIYASRYHLAGLHGASVEHIGQIVACAATSYGTRFDELLQEHALIGSIVNRLLLDESAHDPSFRSETFNRILNDLHRISATREWLREASRLYNRNVVIAAPHEPRGESSGSGLPTRRDVGDLRPSLILEADPSGTWAPSLTPPSLVAWAQQSPEIGRAIESLRYRVIGTDRARQGACLLATAPVQAVLSAFPPLDQPLIELLPRHEGLSAVFDADCRLPACRVLVFRERGGTATLSRKLEVSPGETYLLASQDAALELGEPAACIDPAWYLRRLRLPATLTASLSAQLSSAGIHVRRCIRLRPWGLLPRNWDEENSGEWIVTEPIVYVIARDHLFDAISVSVDKNPPAFFECDGMADPTIVLKELPMGSHNLTVQTYERRQSKSGPSWHELSRGEALVRVRGPSVWTPGRIAANALSIEVRPPYPTLEELLKGEVTLTVEGTAAAPVDVSFQWTDGPAAATSSLSILRQRAPILEAAWTQHMGAFRRKADNARVGLGTRQAFLRVACEPLGEQRLPLGVAASPVRWSARDQLVHLICDGSHTPQVAMSSFSEPVAMADFDRRTCERGLELTQSGLYLAVDGDLRSGVVLGAPSGTAAGFHALGEQIHLDTLRSCDIHELLSAIECWEAAIPLTVYASTNQQRVVNQLYAEALRRVTGDHWIKLETTHPRQWSALEEAVDHPLSVHSFGYSLGRHRGRAHSNDAMQRHFCEAAIAYAVTHDATYLDMAWQLATRPSASPAWASPVSDRLLLARLVRGARLIWLGNQQTSAA